MSWLARSLVNSFRGDDNQESEHNPSTKPGSDGKSGAQVHTFDEQSSPSRGVKEDLSELTKTITRQFWGVASFLAPSPDVSPSDPSDSAASEVSDELEVSKSPRMAGIRSDFAELGGKFKSGISMLSNAKAVSEISKIASTFLPFGDDGAEEEEEDRGFGGEALGVTEDVLLFVKNISVHPETWLDFPLIAGDEDPDEFEMSDAQQEHALAVEHLEPSLAALRIELCPSHMSEGSFWKIYFVLLHSRLNNNDAELLSTPQIVQARAALLQDLESRRKPNANESSWKNKKEEEQPPPEIPSSAPPQAEDASAPIPVLAVETEKHPVESDEVKIIDKSVIEEGRSQKGANRQAYASSAPKPKDDESFEDDWLEDEAGEAKAPAPLGNDEDVSFSDLEEDDDERGGTKWIPKPNPAEGKESRGWVQLSKNRASPAPKSRDGWSDVDELDIE